MSGTYLDFYEEVRGAIPRANVFLAQRWVNRARAEIYRSRFWSFLRSFGYLVVPAVVGTGTFTVTANSTTVVADATAQANLAGLTNPLITGRQIRFAGSPLYNISAYVAPNLTLDRAYGSTSQSGIAYQVYQAYYSTPFKSDGTVETDFIRYLSVLDPVQPQRLRTGHSREWLDMVDQQRTNMGTPSTHLCSFIGGSTALGLPLYEMWPHPTQAKYLLCEYIKKGADFVNDTDSLPAAIPESLLLSKALLYGYQWAMGNAGKYPELKGIQWAALLKDAQLTYREELARSQKLDDDTMKQEIVPQGAYPTWFQSFANQLNYQGGVTVPPNAG